MSNNALDNLVKTGQLDNESADTDEIAALISSGRNRLEDAQSTGLSLNSQFGLAYGASRVFSSGT